MHARTGFAVVLTTILVALSLLIVEPILLALSKATVEMFADHYDLAG